MNRSSVFGSLLALLIGLAIGAAALSWWEGGRQSTEIEALKVRLADERGQVQAKIKQLTDELNSEKQRREALEQVVQQAKRRPRAASESSPDRPDVPAGTGGPPHGSQGSGEATTRASASAGGPASASARPSS